MLKSFFIFEIRRDTLFNKNINKMLCRMRLGVKRTTKLNTLIRLNKTNLYIKIWDLLCYNS